MRRNPISEVFKRPRRCVCGKCATCIDNNRWERVFQEKFGQQERDYYAGGREPRSSGVSANAFAEASIYACAEEGELSNTKVTEAENNVERFYNLLRKARYTDTAA
jgi:hypothetical protein